MIADLRRDPSLAPFLKPKAAVVVWSAADAHALWASPEAMPLVGALTAGGPTAEAERYLRPLAERAPENGIRLERWRIMVGRRAELVTVACRSITTADNERAVLTAVVGSLPKSFATLDFPAVPAVAGTDGEPRADESVAEIAEPAADSAEPSPAEPEVSPETADLHDQRAQLRHLAAMRRTMRFVWACDGTGLITRVSPELAEVVGPDAAAVVGRQWSELVGDIVRDPAGSILEALSRQTTWPRCTVSWRVGQGEAYVPVELGAVPVPGETGDAYRGYGLCRLSEVEEAPAAVSPVVADAVQGEDGEETAVLHDPDETEQETASAIEDEPPAEAEMAELDAAEVAAIVATAESASHLDESTAFEPGQPEERDADDRTDEAAFVTAPSEQDETDAPAETIAAEAIAAEEAPFESGLDDQRQAEDLTSGEGGETTVENEPAEAAVQDAEAQDAQLQNAQQQDAHLQSIQPQDIHVQDRDIQNPEVQETEVQDTGPQDDAAEGAAEGAVVEDVESVAEDAVGDEPAPLEATAEEAVVQDVAADLPVAQDTAAEEHIAPEATAEEAVTQEATAEEAVAADLPIAQDTAVEEHGAPEATADEPVAQDAAAEEPVVPELLVEDAVAFQAPVGEEAPQEEAPDQIDAQTETGTPEEAAEHADMAETEAQTEADADVPAPAAADKPKAGETEAEVTPGPFAPVRGHVGATLGAPKVVPLRVVETSRGGEAEANAPSRPSLSPNERNAFREIARALGARYLGEEEPGGPPPKSRDAEPAAAPRADAAPESPAPIAPAPESVPRSVPDAAAKARQAARQVTFTGDRPSFAPLTDKLPIGILVSRGDDILYANRTLLDFLGYQDVAALAEVGLWNLFASRAQVGDGAAPIALKAANGADLAVDARLSTLEWNGAPATLLSFRRAHEPEIADRIRMLEEELVSHEARAQELSLILDTATDGVIVLDEGGRILSLNRSAEALFGYEESDVAGEFFTLLLAPESHVVAVDYLEGLKAGGVASVMNDGREVVGRVRQGGRSPLMITMGRISEPPHRKFCLVARDMTAFKKAEADLLKAKKAAEDASAQKSDFLAKISHEIRTPLNAIIGFAEVMQEERFGPVGNERYKEYLKDIHVSGGHVISLVNDLLDLAKIEAGRLELNFVSVNLNEIVASCVALLQPEAARGRIVLRTSLAPKLPPVVADERAMRQVVLNILSNAVKFTDAGGQVIVSSALTDRGEVALRVRDTGIGMTDTEIEQALEPFRQLATARRHGGTGLGLPLTKALVEANRGALSITSAKREGTLVEIVLPRTRVLAE
ncbi:ATP-binding protein [Chelatococcus sp. GCM10030263]|uniref:ATP-binding protein n=1 Tax=Chelatococcus sp. GCM10030263 TaxID=3273387 RepID=UPI0036141F44